MSTLSPPSAIFVLNKPEGVSSFAALGSLKRTLGTRKVGHAGTLDPFASGVLVAMSGKLTRIAPLLSGMDKTYTAVFRFGEETDTLDPEGELIAEAPLPDETAIRSAAANFLGEISQIPPAFSAVKIKGQRAYSQARKGRAVDIPPRTVTVHEMEILGWTPPDLRVRIRCSKGTYIRSIARDWGLAVNSRAYCFSLRRDASGPFRLSESTGIQQCSADDGISAPALFKLLNLPVLRVSALTAGSLRHGRPLKSIPGLPLCNERRFLLIDPAGAPAAFIENSRGALSYRIVFD
ncbi:MAG: tRNA pseudouridine(55) synthase TruB [Spirochaetales bacterium]|nr:MAG: tRNA pseudouridine(55) synthase TruB [Spirochaetales bacterium]